ncbi:transposable element Tcb2 transposase [Trichonephila clavipes]|nr:transposable element Tcb2 transposase [Trichonephila clavipes]
MAAQRYVHDILQTHVMALMQGLPGSIYQQDNAPLHTARVFISKLLPLFHDLPDPPDLSPIEFIWDHLGQSVGPPTSLNELEVRLQRIWNEMTQDIIQNLYASMPIVSHRAFTLEGV